MGVTLAALLQSKSAAWAFATYATFGCALSLFWPTVQGWLSTGREGPELGRTMSRFNIAWGGANMASPYICGWMAEQSLVLPIQVSSLLYVAVAIFVAGVGWMVPGIRNDPGRVETREAGPAEDRSSYFRFPAWVGLFACYFGAGMIASTFPMAGKEVLHLSERTIGGILLVQAAANVAGFLALGKLHFWHFRLYPMNVALLIRVAMFVLLIFVNSPVGISLIMVVLGATWATGYSASIFHGASGSRDRAKRMTIHESVIASAILFGGVAGAMLYERWSIRVSYGACAAVSLLGIAIQSAVAAAMKAKERGGRTTMLNAEC
jgi:predicted MFS family arabinose efflux permease